MIPLSSLSRSGLFAALLPLALTFSMAESAAAAPLQCPGDDGFGNNSTGTAQALTPGSFRTTNRAVIGIGTATASTDVGNDWFTFDLGPGATMEIDAFSVTPGNGIYIQLYTSSIGFIDGTNLNDPQSLSYVNTNGATETYFLRVASGTAATSCREYYLETRSTTCPGDDFFGPLDTCDTGLFLSVVDPINLERLSIQDGSDDWYKTQLQPGETLTVDMRFPHAVADLDLELRDRTSGSCGNTLTNSVSTTDNEFITYTNTSSSLLLVSIGATWFSSSAGNVCSDYELYYEITGSTPGDAYEENDDICSAAYLPIGVTSDLNVSSTDSDFYYVEILGDIVTTAAIDFDHSQGDLDLRLWHIGIDCNNPTLLDTSAGVTDYEEVSGSWGSAGITTYVIEVYNFSQGVVTDYELTIGQGLAANLGQTVCVGIPNSLDRVPFLLASGSVVVADNDLSFNCNSLPPNTFGFFNTSMGYNKVSNPGGSDGVLCIAGAPIGRFVGPGQILNSGSSGEFNLDIDLTTMPQPTGAVAALPGETWFFQVWYRDAFGGFPTSNFSSATRVRFE